MASFGNIICRASNCVQRILLKDSSLNLSRVLTCQPNRQRKRATKPPGWFVPVEDREKNEDLTEENLKYVKEYYVKEYTKRYKNRQKGITAVRKAQQSPLKEEPWKRGTWDFKTKRTGVLAIKLGRTSQWNRKGERFEVTVLQVIDNHVVNYIPPETFMNNPPWKPWWRKQYGSVVVGALSCDPTNFSREYNKLFLKAGVPTKRKLTRFIVTPNAAIQPGVKLNAMHFRVGDYVDCQAKTIDYGFQGVVRRFGFKGGRASHGTTKNYRRPGSTGSGRRCSGHLKGTKLPGHMGGDWKATKGCRIIRMNTKYNLLYIQGSCVGPNHCFVRVMDTSLPNRRCQILVSQNPPPMPTTFPEDLKGGVPEEIFHDSLFQFTEPSISYAVDEDTPKKKR